MAVSFLRARRAITAALALLVWLLGGLGAVQAANHYVCSSAAGNADGSDWANAYQSLPTTLIRGDTYYVATGQYPGYSFDTAADGDSTITIKKALPADHGTDSGWTAAMGTGVAKFTGDLRFRTSGWVFDGQVGGGPASWRSGHGFELEVTADNNNNHLIYVDNVNNITIRHVNMHMTNQDWFGDAFYGGYSSNITISHCYIHDWFGCGILMNHWNGLLFEYNCLQNNKSTPELHSEGIADWGNSNVTIRYNWWEDIEGTASVVAGINGNYDNPSTNWLIYGNVVVRRLKPTVSTFIVVYDNGDNSNTANNWRIFNNVIFNISNNSWSGITIQRGSGNLAYNNVWYNSTWTHFQGVNHDYNWFQNTPHEPEEHEQSGPWGLNLFQQCQLDEPFRFQWELRYKTPDTKALNATVTSSADPQVLYTQELSGTAGQWQIFKPEFSTGCLLNGTMQRDLESTFSAWSDSLNLTLAQPDLALAANEPLQTYHYEWKLEICDGPDCTLNSIILFSNEPSTPVQLSSFEIE